LERRPLEDAEPLITAWNERQAKRIPMLFSPTIGAAITAGYRFCSAHISRRRTKSPSYSGDQMVTVWRTGRAP
jgi:hypothetical protein